MIKMSVLNVYYRRKKQLVDSVVNYLNLCIALYSKPRLMLEFLRSPDLLFFCNNYKTYEKS